MINFRRVLFFLTQQSCPHTYLDVVATPNLRWCISIHQRRMQRLDAKTDNGWKDANMTTSLGIPRYTGGHIEDGHHTLNRESESLSPCHQTPTVDDHQITQGTNGKLDPSTFNARKNTTYETGSSPTQICVEKDDKTRTFTRTFSKMSWAKEHQLNIFHHVACMWPR